MLFLIIVGLHFFAALFMHSFFLHRYATHQQFAMSRTTERFCFLATWLLQGPSFLNPTAYAKMHLQHHAHSDQPADPHSPLNFSRQKWGRDVLTASMRMMLATKRVFAEITAGRHAIARMYTDRRFPTWREVEIIANSTLCKVFLGALIVGLYIVFAPSAWYWPLAIISILNGPIQGGIVNWCGHMWGYRNYVLPDNSKNTWLFSTLMFGELFQNNHHHDPNNPNFGGPRWYEFDPMYPCLVALNWMGVIRITKAKK